jgi:ABC-type Fe3+ transport system substrate-binding protein
VARLPVKVVPFNPRGAPVSVSAPHPDSALLFIDFLLRSEGQRIYADKLFYFGATAKVIYES